MPVAYLLVRRVHAGSAFDGEGAARFGGRWNSRGIRLVYASATLSLAALETLVHVDRSLPVEYAWFRCEFPAATVSKLSPSRLPPDWRIYPAGSATQRLGDEWILDARSAVLRVPNVLVPGEFNFLLNPEHSHFRRIVVSSPEPFAFDPRLIEA